MKTHTMMAHVRYATKGDAGELENVHPFSREMWGIQWCFCHNGDIPKFSPDANATLDEHYDMPVIGKAKDLLHSVPSYNPIGDTDSEAVFCAILNALKAEFVDVTPTLPELHETLQRLCCEIVAGYESETIFNFLLACGPVSFDHDMINNLLRSYALILKSLYLQYTLFAFSWPGSRPNSTVWNGLYYTLRKNPFTSASLVDCDYTMDFSKVNKSTDAVAVIATKPLTKDEEWIEMKRCELLLFDHGVPHSVSHECEAIELQGRGLWTKVKSMRRSRFSSFNESICSDTISVSSSQSGGETSSLSLSSSWRDRHHMGPIIVANVDNASKVLKKNQSDTSRLVAFCQSLH